MTDLFKVLSEISMQIAEWIIVLILVDDVYGFSNIRKLTKRRLRKFHRDFLKTAKRYIHGKEKPQQ